MLNGKIPSDIKNLEKLTKLNLSFNYFTELVPQLPSSLKNLKLDNNLLIGEKPNLVNLVLDKKDLGHNCFIDSLEPPEYDGANTVEECELYDLLINPPISNESTLQGDCVFEINCNGCQLISGSSCSKC